MASIHKETRNGRTLWRIQFYDKNNKRQSIRLRSGINRKGAELIRARVETLVSASITGAALDNEISHWITDRGDDLASKLARHGLIPGKQQIATGDGVTLGGFLDGYFASKAFRKPNTRRNYEVTRGHLLYRERLRMAQIDVGEKGEVWENDTVELRGIPGSLSGWEREVQGCAVSSSRKKSSE